MPISKIGPVLLSLAGLLGIISACFSTIRLWHPEGIVIVGGSRLIIIPLIISTLLAVVLAKFKVSNLRFSPSIFVFGLVLVFFSNWLFNPYGLLPAPSSRGTILFFFLVTTLCHLTKIRINWSLIALTCLSILIYCFLNEANGKIITSDDHATFLHRLILLRDNLFNIPVYDPFWNMGYDQRYFFATGAINYFLITLPLTIFFNPADVYNFCFVLSAIALPFFSVYIASRLLGLSTNASWIAALLALAPSSEWFRWTLQYGTMGFVVATGLIPINIALSMKILNTEDKFPLYYAILLIITFTIMLFWSMAGLAFLPLIILGLFKTFSARLLRKNYVSLVLASLLIINAPWILTFWSVSNVGNFLKSEKQEVTSAQPQSEKSKDPSADTRYKHKAAGFDPLHSLSLVRDFTSTCNPLILFLALPGLFILEKKFRWKLIASLLWMLGFALIFVQIKPQFELDRFLVIFILLATIPTALTIEKLLNFNRPKNLLLSILFLLQASLVAGYLIAVPIAANAFVKRHSVIKYTFQGNLTEQLIAELKNYHNQGRVLFSGMIMHEIDGGHLAAIPELSGTPVIATSFLHNIWSYQQVFPQEVLDDKDTRIPEYLSLNNVVAVLAHDPIWIKYFEQKPDIYKLKKRIGKFVVFDFLGSRSSYFQFGSGELVQQNNHSLTIKLQQADAVIKFRYFPFLESNSSCQITPKLFLGGLELIELKGCPVDQEITIKSKAAWKRI